MKGKYKWTPYDNLLLNLAGSDCFFSGISDKMSLNGIANILKSMKKPDKKKPVIVAVSGGFDPIHIGHIRLFNEAKKLGDKLIVILNNDNWLIAKKGYVFMPQQERKEILASLASVDKVIFTGHAPNPKDMSVCRELEKIKPHIFANGGDRKPGNVPEAAVCQSIGCKLVYNTGKGGKVQSSSQLIKNATFKPM